MVMEIRGMVSPRDAEDEYQLRRGTKNFWKAGDDLYCDVGGDFMTVYTCKSE